MIVYVVGRPEPPPEGEKESRWWHLQGVFSDEAKAVSACTRWDDFVGPAEMDRDLGDTVVPWPGLYYPMAEAHTAGNCLPNCVCKVT